jgi:hypothetical protein
LVAQLAISAGSPKFLVAVVGERLFPPGGTHRLYGRQDARRYFACGIAAL